LHVARFVQKREECTLGSASTAGKIALGKVSILFAYDKEISDGYISEKDVKSHPKPRKKTLPNLHKM